MKIFNHLNIMKIYLIRHAESEANRKRIVQGTMDSPLTERGRKQARSLANLLPDDLDHIYTSPLERAIETARLALDIEPSSSDLTKMKGLQEIHFGDLQGTPYNEVPFTKEKVQGHLSFQLDMLKGTQNAEKIDDFLDRSLGAFFQIIQDMKDNDWNQVAVFTHGGVLRSILQFHLELTEKRFLNTEIAILMRSNDQWSITRLRDHILRNKSH